jgi:hypothetical protein
MKSIYWMIGAALALLAVPSAQAQDGGPWSGPWETNQGRMHIEQDGDRARGDYDLKDGRVHGDVDGDVFRGVWSQSSAKRYCREERMGSHYWGRFNLRLSDDGRYFQGRWWYCEDDPNDGGEWTGHRPHRHHD